MHNTTIIRTQVCLHIVLKQTIIYFLKLLIKTEGGSLLALHQKNCDSAPCKMSIAFARAFASQFDIGRIP